MAKRTTTSTVEIVKLDQAIEKVNLEVLDPNLQALLRLLLNKVEEQEKVIKGLLSENQAFRNEINRLKGEKGKPTIRPQTPSGDISSEKERKTLNSEKTKRSKRKNHKITVNRIEKCKIDKSKLPEDAIFKGLRSVIVQDLLIHTDNVEFQKECYYSPSLNKTFMGQVPKGYEGEFGPGVKAYVLSTYYESNMTESAIVKTLQTHGILISACTVSRILTDHKEEYHQEKEEIVKEGLLSSLPKQMDDTGARVGGKNQVAHILCNVWFTSYFTRPHKDRLTLLEILNQGPLTYRVDDVAYALMEEMTLSSKWIHVLKTQSLEKDLTQEAMDELLKELFPDPQAHQKNRKVILEATALAAYRAKPDSLKILLSDEAPQFHLLTSDPASCWIHEGRHYKKLTPCFTLHQIYLEKFLKKFWAYYKALLKYKDRPRPASAKRLSQRFDTLFSEKTGYDELDKRIAMTAARKTSLLLVLRFPKLPLHNNASELGARAQARKRDISLHTMSQKGTEAKDTLMTIAETAKKQSVNIYHYFYDRITQTYKMPSLAKLIKLASVEHSMSPLSFALAT